MPTMLKRILHISVLIFALAASAAAQNPYLQGSLSGGTGVPGTKTRSALNTMERAAGSLAGVTILTDTFGNQRLALYVHIEDTCINYTPAATGNTNNLSAFVEKCSTDSVWYIDFEGKSQFIGAAGSACDADWLEITSNGCPDNINDSIYTQKYAAVGARLVWPTAELLVSDSTGVQVTVLSGNRNSRLGFWDNFNQFYSTIDQSGASTIWYFEPTGEMRWTTAGGGTPQAPGAPFVNQFAINPAATPLPTIQAHQYPNTRNDTATVRNFLYTDPNGNHRSQPIDSLVVIVVDSIQADTTLQRNWYTHNGVTTDLGRVAFVKRTAWWRTLDSLGFFRWTNRPDNFDGSQFTIFQDSITLDADTILWKSSWHPASQFHELQATGTYFYADSLKVVGIGQFPTFPNLTFDGTEKGFFYDPSNEGLLLLDGDGVSGGYSYIYIGQTESEILNYNDASGLDQTVSNFSSNANNAFIDFSVRSDESPYSQISASVLTGDPAVTPNLFYASLGELDTNELSLIYLGQAALGSLYVGRRAFGVRTFLGETPFDWIQSYLPNDTTENAVSFYNRAYYWRNELPTATTGDTIVHYWAEDGVNAGKNPGFMTIEAIRAGADNWYNSNDTTTDNTRIAYVRETATWFSDDIASDGVVPFRWQLSAAGAQNEPEMMVWEFDSGDSLLLSQSDQEIIFFSNNYLVSKTDQAFTIQADSFQYNPNLGGTGFKVGANNVFTQNAITGAATHRDAIEYNTITGTGQTELFLDGSSAILVVPTNSVQNFKIHIAAICSAAGNGVGISTGDAYASWHLGGIKRVTNTTSLVGSVQADATAQSDASMTDAAVTIDADDTDDSLRIRFTPPSTAGTTTVIRVVATIEIAQNNY